jgi:hypothetical protein
VSDVKRWESVKPTLRKALSFLSGDHWELSFVRDTVERPQAEPLLQAYDGVSLFSGGLDSLSGVIDMLEEGKTLALVGHHDSPLTDSKQSELFALLSAKYGEHRLHLQHLYLRPGGRRRVQARPLPRAIENTTRSRSFLFFAAGLAVADALGNVPLYVPETVIGINVPLTPARAGSLSTRTTHPLYMKRIGEVLDGLGLRPAMENPYRLMTKGEVLEHSRNRRLFRRLAPRSISCSHPEAPRWVKRPQGNCGYCYPCLIRRAAMHHIGHDKQSYAWDALNDAGLLERTSKRGRSLRALAASLGRDERIEDVLAAGRVPNGEVEDFFDVYCRGRAELRAWLADAGPALSRRLHER